MYHSISDSDDYQELPRACRPIGYRIGTGVFEDHLAALKQDGWSSISLEELITWTKLPRKAIVITFDDGYADNYHTALPLLLKYGFKATFFISVAYLGEIGMMGGTELKELLRSGMEIGSHGMVHDLLAGVSESDLSRELKESKRSLSKRFSITTDFFSIPRGYLPAALPRLARTAGYQGICTSCPGFNTDRIDPFALKRFPVRSSWMREELEAILTGKGILYRRLLLIENIRSFLRRRHRYKYLLTESKKL